MSANDVAQQVLEAFYVEHQEQLEQIRALVEALKTGHGNVDAARVQDAFRMAHSFKGGARVCDLRNAEQLGHGLETVLEKLSRGELCATTDVVTTIELVLDTIEDWMAALERNQQLPTTDKALVAIEQVLGERSWSSRSANGATDAATKLAEVFRAEYEQHAGTLRRLLDQWQLTGGIPPDGELAEARRVVHTLAGAAAVVNVGGVEAPAQTMETLLRQLTSGEREFDEAVLSSISELVAAMDESMRDEPSTNTGSSDLPLPLGKSRDQGESAAKKVPSPYPLPKGEGFETVRVDVESLDRLVQTCGALWTESQRVERMTRQLNEFRREVDDLDREREAVRRATAAGFHQLVDLPQFERVSQYMECVDQRVSRLARQIRQLCLDQQKTSWLVRSRCGQIQRDVYETRMVPAHSIFQGFRKMVRDIASAEGKQIDFRLSGLEVRADRMVLQALKDPLMHVLRNCVTHGIEKPEERRTAGKPATGMVSVDFKIDAGRLCVQIDDDGRGIDASAVARRAVRQGLLSEAEAAQQPAEELAALIFEPGFTTSESVTELAGRGMGLSIVQESVTQLQGEVRLIGKREPGMRVAISVPIAVSSHRLLLVTCCEQEFAIPLTGIERLLRQPRSKTETVGGRPVLMHQEHPIPLVWLSDLLGIDVAEAKPSKNDMLSIVLLKTANRRLAVVVDSVIEELSALMADLDSLARRGEFGGAIVLEDGRTALVLNPAELIDHVQPRAVVKTIDKIAAADMPASILVVDDSFTTRTLEKNTLEAQGYRVGVAVDGAEALDQLQRDRFDLVISDIEMPRVDGFALLRQMKADKRMAKVPVILVTSRDRQEDQQTGLELGAEAYVVKRKFDHQELLRTIEQIL